MIRRKPSLSWKTIHYFCVQIVQMRNVILAFLVSLSFVSGLAQQRSVGPQEFENGIKQENVQVLDVRTAAEFNSGHIKNALQADWTNQAQFMDRVSYVDKDRAVYIYCLAGGRSNAAAEWMRSNGFKKVVELKGGINAWKKENKPVEGASTEPQLTKQQYFSSIPDNKTVLVDFGAEWCPPCVKMKPVLEELEKDKDLKFQLLKIDAGVHTNLMKELNIEPIPVFILYKKGKEVWRKQGIVSKDELKKLLK